MMEARGKRQLMSSAAYSPYLFRRYLDTGGRGAGTLAWKMFPSSKAWRGRAAANQQQLRHPVVNQYRQVNPKKTDLENIQNKFH